MFGKPYVQKFLDASQEFCTLKLCGPKNYVYEQFSVVCQSIVLNDMKTAKSKLQKTLKFAKTGFKSGVLGNLRYRKIVEVAEYINTLIAAREGGAQPVQTLSDLPVSDILHVWAYHPELFKASSDQVVYMAKRAVSKEFTEVVLSSKAGSYINKVLIWEVAAFGAELLYRITGGLQFYLAAVGSYSIVCQFFTDKPVSPMEKLAHEKLSNGTDLDCKIIGLCEQQHAAIYQRILDFVYSDLSKKGVRKNFSDFKSKIASTWILDRLDEESINLCGFAFNGSPNTERDNFFIARKQIQGAPADIASFVLPDLDRRISLSVTHIQGDGKEFVVFRFKYARSCVSPSGELLTAKVCFLDLSICKHYDKSYTCNMIPHTYSQFLDMATDTA